MFSGMSYLRAHFILQNEHSLFHRFWVLFLLISFPCLFPFPYHVANVYILICTFLYVSLISLLTYISTNKMDFCHFCITDMGHLYSLLWILHFSQNSIQEIHSVSDVHVLFFIDYTLIISTTIYLEIFCPYKRCRDDILVFYFNISILNFGSYFPPFYWIDWGDTG